MLIFFKFSSCLFCETVNIYLLCRQENLIELIMNYVALFGITEIDKKYVESLRSMEVLDYFNIPEDNNY